MGLFQRACYGIILVFAVLLLNCATASSVYAQESMLFEGETKSPPPPPIHDGPIHISVGVYILQITSIDQTDEEFSIEGFMDWIWHDPRLAFDAEEYGAAHTEFVNEEVKSLLFRNQIWWPDLEITNERGKRAIEDRVLTVHADGKVEYMERFHASIQADFNLKKFPFDPQTFHIRLESFIYPHTIVQLGINEHRIGYSDHLGEEEWVLSKVTPVIADREEIRSDEAFSEFTLELDLHRQTGFYFFRIFVPLISIITVFCGTFLLSDYKTQLTANTTTFLTLVAFNFAIANSLPKLAFLTFLDSIIMVSFLLAALSILLILFMLRFEQRGQTELANKINRFALWCFPSAYSITIGILWIIFEM